MKLSPWRWQYTGARCTCSTPWNSRLRKMEMFFHSFENLKLLWNYLKTFENIWNYGDHNHRKIHTNSILLDRLTEFKTLKATEVTANFTGAIKQRARFECAKGTYLDSMAIHCIVFSECNSVNSVCSGAEEVNSWIDLQILFLELFQDGALSLERIQKANENSLRLITEIVIGTMPRTPMITHTVDSSEERMKRVYFRKATTRDSVILFFCFFPKKLHTIQWAEQFSWLAFIAEALHVLHFGLVAKLWRCVGARSRLGIRGGWKADERAREEQSTAHEDGTER